MVLSTGGIETDISQDGLPYLDLAQSTLPTPGDQEKLNVQVEIQASHLLLLLLLLELLLLILLYSLYMYITYA